jgi:hypothetical protein
MFTLEQIINNYLNKLIIKMGLITVSKESRRYLTFILLTLQTLTKLKTTFGRNLLYWML